MLILALVTTGLANVKPAATTQLRHRLTVPCQWEFPETVETLSSQSSETKDLTEATVTRLALLSANERTGFVDETSVTAFTSRCFYAAPKRDPTA